MGIIKVLLIIIEVVTCFLLVGIILLQKSKSEGLGLAFGAGVGETIFGSRAGNVLTKGTVILAGVFLVNTTLLGMLFASAQDTSIVERRTAGMPDQPQRQPMQQTLPVPSEGAGAAVPSEPVVMPAGAVVPAADSSGVVMPQESAPAAAEPAATP